MAKPQRIGNDELERHVLTNIAEFGWHSVNVVEDDGHPPWTFTIGLFETWQHPELIRAGSGFSDRSISGMTAIFFHNSRSDSDETTETQPLAGFQGEGGLGSLERREDDRAACCAL
jgi:hypothetical protein